MVGWVRNEYYTYTNDLARRGRRLNKTDFYFHTGNLSWDDLRVVARGGIRRSVSSASLLGVLSLEILPRGVSRSGQFGCTAGSFAFKVKISESQSNICRRGSRSPEGATGWDEHGHTHAYMNAEARVLMRPLWSFFVKASGWDRGLNDYWILER